MADKEKPDTANVDAQSRDLAPTELDQATGGLGLRQDIDIRKDLYALVVEDEPLHNH